MKPSIRTVVVGSLKTNCYLLTEVASKETVIIDPGDDASYLASIIEEMKAVPVAIVATHGHFDHVLGVWELVRQYTIPFYIHPKDQFLLRRMNSSAQKYLERQIVEPVPTEMDDLYEGRNILFGSSALTTIETPGHTPGSVSFTTNGGATLFCGDTLFADGGVGDWRHRYSDKEVLDQSVQKILSYPPSSDLYPGHGRETTVENERIWYKEKHTYVYTK